MQRVTIAGFVVAALFGASAPLYAQVPSRVPQVDQRAREACDAAATRYGYRVIRRNPQRVSGNEYQLPMHVAHGSTETDITCRYDMQRGVANLPAWEDRPVRVAGGAANRLTTAQIEAQQQCQNAINARPGYQVRRVGTPVKHGARQWDVPATVRRDGSDNMRVTCRYNTANNRVTLKPR